MKSGSSFLLGVAVGAAAILVLDRAMKLIGEEDIESLKNRVADNLKSLEGAVSGIAEGISDSLAEARDR